jgi:hypothetical protein
LRRRQAGCDHVFVETLVPGLRVARTQNAYSGATWATIPAALGH